MYADTRTMTEVFGPTRALVGSREDPVCCAAATALLLARCEHCVPQDWLACACSTLSTLTPDETLVGAMLAEPAQAPTYWKSVACAVGGRYGQKLLDAVLADLRAGMPSDDLAEAFGHRAMWPRAACVRRADLVTGEEWATSRYRAWRRGLGLGEFVRAVAPMEDHLGRPRTLIVQFDGVGHDWSPDEAFVRMAGAASACLWAAFRERFVAPMERSEQALALLKPLRRRIAQLIVAGKSESQIGAIVERSPHTVRDHVKAMYSLFEVSTRHELIARLSGVRRPSLSPGLPDSPLVREEPLVAPGAELKPRSRRSSPAGSRAATSPSRDARAATN